MSAGLIPYLADITGREREKTNCSHKGNCRAQWTRGRYLTTYMFVCNPDGFSLTLYQLGIPTKLPCCNRIDR